MFCYCVVVLFYFGSCSPNMFCCFVDVSMDGPMEIPMPGGRSEVFRVRGCEAERLPEEHTPPRWVVPIG